MFDHFFVIFLKAQTFVFLMHFSLHIILTPSIDICGEPIICSCIYFLVY